MKPVNTIYVPASKIVFWSDRISDNDVSGKIPEVLGPKQCFCFHSKGLHVFILQSNMLHSK